MIPVKRTLAILLCASSGLLHAQDDTLSAAARRPLPIDTSRIAPFTRTYDIVLRTRDSTARIGERTVTARRTTLLGTPAWLLLETRTGLIPAAESLYLAPDLRPLRWSAVLGPARLAIQFGRDSMFGASTSPLHRLDVVAAVPPDVVVSGPMVELLLPTLFPVAGRIDSVMVLSIDPARSVFHPGALIVMEQEELRFDTGQARPAWVVALHTEPGYVLFWVDSRTGAVVRVQHYLERDRALLEYQLRSAAPAPP